MKHQNPPTENDVRKALRRKADRERARHSERFFKTGSGQYAEGDRFLGVRVPEQRKIAKAFRALPLDHISLLLESEYHEERLTALLILELQFPKADESQKEAIVTLCLERLNQINNWDLVDLFAPKLLGPWLENRRRKFLYELSDSKNLWHRRIAIMATFHFIRNGSFDETLSLADRLLEDRHDLIHKAVGWMLREIGNRDQKILEEFLLPRYSRMPRTMLRYAIERLPEERRQQYLKGAAG